MSLDCEKLIIGILAYVIAAPLLGYLLAGWKNGPRWGLCLLAFLTSCFPTKISFMLDSIEWYRGHTKGFEFSLIVAFSIAIIVAVIRSRYWGDRLVPPGAFVYLAFCLAGTISVIKSMQPTYGMMATDKFLSALVIFVAAYHAFRTAEDIRWLLRTFALMLLIQAFVCLKLRYLDGRWIALGWFEHQNALAMWAYTCAMPLLALSIAEHTSRRDAVFFFLGYIGAGISILLTVSRASLAAYVCGSVAVYAMAFYRGAAGKAAGQPTRWVQLALQAIRRRSSRIWAIGMIGVVGALLVFFFGLNSLRARLEYNDKETENLRSAMNRQAKAMLKDHFLGVGWNNYGLANSRPNGAYSYILERWDRENFGYTDGPGRFLDNPLTESLYWLFLAETGYPCTLLLILFMGISLWWGFRSLAAYWDTPLTQFVWALVVVLCLNYGHSFVERILTQSKNIAMWMLILGCLSKLHVVRPGATTKRVQQSFWVLFIVRSLRGISMLGEQFSTRTNLSKNQ